MRVPSAERAPAPSRSSRCSRIATVSLVGHDRHRPQHQDETRLLLEIAHDDENRTLLDGRRVLLQTRRLLCEDRVGLWPNPGGIDRMHHDDRNEERRRLVDELHRITFLKRCHQMSTGKETSLSAVRISDGTKDSTCSSASSSASDGGVLGRNRPSVKDQHDAE